MPNHYSDTGDLLRPRELAELIGVRTATIARWASEGKLTPLRTPGGHRRYSKADISRLLAGKATPSEAEQELATDAARLYDQGWSIRQVAETTATAPCAASCASTPPCEPATEPTPRIEHGSAEFVSR
ncbi:hypothetical protein GCM10027176_09010 [Actinoallomurus bryophytorum]|uniref:MerR family transcriptional regulator n=1 Tax=Actinoallomurus bryophytorum TaxID=1490222 RepID=UPI001152CA6D|nr:MerR family transcriptional regulator [Actinoallomurus bryophytorum]